MNFVNKPAISGLLAGILLTVSGMGSYARAGSSGGHDMCNDDLRSITGSPAELAQRTRKLGEHVCQNIQVATDCPVTPAVDAAVKALNAMQGGYQDGQGRMHELLTSANFDRVEFNHIQTQQAQAVLAGTTRYMQFLADAATALTPEQRQLFSHGDHSRK